MSNTTTDTAGAGDFRRDLTRHLVAAEHGGKPTMVTRNGHPAAMLLPAAWLDDLINQSAAVGPCYSPRRLSLLRDLRRSVVAS